MLKSPLSWILIFWVLITALNVNKAFHIDDTFHLKAAQWINDNPTRPMSGYINWNREGATPIYEGNQPPLYFYMIAVVADSFGYTSIPLHLFQSLFTLLALFFFHKIMAYTLGRFSLSLFILFAFCPAFLLNHNLMTDIPLLSLLMASVYFLLQSRDSKKHYLTASVFLTLAILIKYSAFPLLFVMWWVILYRKDFQHLLTAAIPVVVLIMWSIWNLWEFDSIHIFSRNSIPFLQLLVNLIPNLLAFIATLGSIVYVSILIINAKNPAARSSKVMYSLLGITLIATILALTSIIPVEAVNILLFFLFLINGSIITFSILKKGIRETKRLGIKKFLAQKNSVIYLTIASFSFFFVVFSPFMASRHILLILPFLLIISFDYLQRSNIFASRLTVALTVVIGIFIGISDLNHAHIYRKLAKEIPKNTEVKVWTVGHWGWQWYAENQGLKSYDPKESLLQDGDLIIYPRHVREWSLAQQLPKDVKLEIIEEKHVYPNVFNPIATFHMYLSFFPITPWSITDYNKPVETLIIGRVKFEENKNRVNEMTR